MVAAVVVRIGSFGTSSRTHVPVPDARFPFTPDMSFSDLVDAVAVRVEAALSAYEHVAAREDSTVYLRPTPTAPQKDLIPLTAENYRARVAAARSLFERRRNPTGGFVFELFVFAVKRSAAPAAHRATQPRIAASATSIGCFLDERPDMRVGEIARTHWAFSQARRPNGTPVEMPTTATFRQAQHIDAIRESVVTPPSDPEFGVVSARIMGSHEMVLELKISDLRRVLGLPAHNLLAEGIFRTFVPPEMPAEDVPDVDHEYSDEENE